MVDPNLSVPAAELEALFDVLPDVVFFVKDGEGRYTHANLTLVARLGFKRRQQIVRHVADVATGAKALRAPLPLAEWKRTASAVWTLRLSRQLPWEPREAPTSRAA